MAINQLFDPGYRLIDGSDLNNAFAQPRWQTNPGIVALAGGGLSASTPVLVIGTNLVKTVASASDSVVLPSGTAGSIVLVRNNGANSMQVFAQGSDTINGTAGATGISVANAKTVLFAAVDDVAGVTTWVSLLSA